MSKNTSIYVKGVEINVSITNGNDYISLTDIAKSKNSDDPRFVIQNWMKTRYTIEFLGFWELLNNPNFNRVYFDTFKNEAGSNSFVLTPLKWIENTNAIGIKSKSGRYGGGTFAHKDIAFEFASWISAEFKLYLIQEFQRLKDDENQRLNLDWSFQRTLSKINYTIHTDAIKENLIPKLLNKDQINLVYSNEADLLNVALFGITAKIWREKSPSLSGNIRDYATLEQLVILSNLESLNAVLIQQGKSQKERLITLNSIAISQMNTLLKNIQIKKLGNASK
ncbi:MAG: KilA-N domain-containing protein [Candidatus Kapabacteria bacterium]|nr:KilA-N domain-containing protein [Candidatus Kapabacteria bacterium]